MCFALCREPSGSEVPCFCPGVASPPSVFCCGFVVFASLLQCAVWHPICSCHAPAPSCGGFWFFLGLLCLPALTDVASPRPPSPLPAPFPFTRLIVPSARPLPIFRPSRSPCGWRVFALPCPPLCNLFNSNFHLHDVRHSPATPPVAARTRGKTLVTATDKCASFVVPPLPASSDLDALPAPPSPAALRRTWTPCRLQPLHPRGPLDVPPRSTSPSASPPQDPSWSLTFTPSQSQRATHSRIMTPFQSSDNVTSPDADLESQLPSVTPTHLPEPHTRKSFHQEPPNDSCALLPDLNIQALSPNITVKQKVDAQLTPPSPLHTSSVNDFSRSPRKRLHLPIQKKIGRAASVRPTFPTGRIATTISRKFTSSHKK
ncbi:hypothetical protein JTE90_018857 [Oedothorax gibbosus]|uniref:Uncharacterized protein n=1 Tax=Oedothorax gibbosus TaxID=931172 RepID=A0AAV6TV33_9ARAC|nr:hypothetical protein JTE90_018857 [Oedothorax gibbosus]